MGTLYNKFNQQFKKNYSEMLLSLNANTKPKKSNLDILLWLCAAWLDKIKSEVFISELTIPAAHQTLCNKDFWSNQQKSLEWLLDNGVRGLDVRTKDHRNANFTNKPYSEYFNGVRPFYEDKCKFCNHPYKNIMNDQNSRLTVWHEGMSLNHTIICTLNKCLDWLENHKKEFLMIKLRHECGGYPDKKGCECREEDYKLLLKKMEDNGRFILMRESINLHETKLADLRGKIVVFCHGFPKSEKILSIDESFDETQDIFIDGPINIVKYLFGQYSKDGKKWDEYKFDEVKKLQSSEHKLRCNFISGGPPKILRLRESIPLLGGKSFPSSNLNEKYLDWIELKENKDYTNGLIFMDSLGSLDIKRLIKLNDKHLQKTHWTSKSQQNSSKKNAPKTKHIL